MSKAPRYELEMSLKENRYGFKINIAHPLIAPLYEQYRIANNISSRYPIDDADRFAFEEIIIDAWERRVKNNKKVGDINETEKTA